MNEAVFDEQGRFLIRGRMNKAIFIKQVYYDQQCYSYKSKQFAGL